MASSHNLVSGSRMRELPVSAVHAFQFPFFYSRYPYLMFKLYANIYWFVSIFVTQCLIFLGEGLEDLNLCILYSYSHHSWFIQFSLLGG